MNYYHNLIKNFLLEVGVIEKEEQFKISKLHNFEQCIYNILKDDKTEVHEFTYDKLYIFRISQSEERVIKSITNYDYLVKHNHKVIKTFCLDNGIDVFCSNEKCEHYKYCKRDFCIGYDKGFEHTMMDDLDEMYGSRSMHEKLYTEFRHLVKRKTSISYKKFAWICADTNYNYVRFNDKSFNNDKDGFVDDFIEKFASEIYRKDDK